MFEKLCEQVKSKAVTVQPYYRLRGFQEVEAPRFGDSRNKKVVRSKVSNTHRPPLPLWDIFLVLISVRGCITPRALVWLEGLCQ